jgi:ABC-type glycerol-3-phosphate transport system permease component
MSRRTGKAPRKMLATNSPSSSSSARRSSAGPRLGAGRRPGGGNLLVWTVLAAVVAVNLCPFFWAVLSSFKPGSEINSETFSLFPHRWTCENYRNMFYNMAEFARYYRNSILTTIATVVLTLFTGSLAAFALARFRFPGRDAIFYVLVFSMFLPGEIVLIGQFELFYRLRLLNKMTGLSLAYTAGGLGLVLFIMRNVFRAIPQDLLDAAEIDGASAWQVFWEIMVPLSGAGLVAAAVMTFMFAWNEFLFAVTATWSSKAQTLPVGIMLLRDQFQHWDYGMLYATLLLSFLPVMIVFVALQKQFIRGAIAGAVKG